MSGARPPAEPGMTLDHVATPALLVDLAALEANIAALAATVAEHGAHLRPHAKTHKSPDIARRQIAAGAVGVCCQTVREAEAMVAGGIADVVLTNQLAEPTKAARLAALARTARIGVCVDHPAQVALLQEAAHQAGVLLHVLVEIDVGGGRCGAGSAEAALALAQAVHARAALRLQGVQAYHGAAQHLRTPAERQAAIAHACGIAAVAVQRIRGEGLPCQTITGAGTGSFALEATSGLYTELQCGSYVFMDADYARNDPAPPFAHALTVLATVISTPAPGRVVCDAGLKAISLDSGPPSLALHPGLAWLGPSDEHATLRAEPGVVARVGDKLRLIPGHCDPTVGLHDWLVVHDGAIVRHVWPVARGW